MKNVILAALVAASAMATTASAQVTVFNDVWGTEVSTYDYAHRGDVFDRSTGVTAAQQIPTGQSSWFASDRDIKVSSSVSSQEFRVRANGPTDVLVKLDVNENGYAVFLVSNNGGATFSYVKEVAEGKFLGGVTITRAHGF